MQNSEGKYVDLYIPRKCQATNRILDCKDTASVQITLNTEDLEKKEIIKINKISPKKVNIKSKKKKKATKKK